MARFAVAVVAGLALVGNTCAYVNVATDKLLGRDAQTSAVNCMEHYVPIMNSIGYRVGHDQFYGSPDVIDVALGRENTSARKRSE